MDKKISPGAQKLSAEFCLQTFTTPTSLKVQTGEESRGGRREK